MEVEEPHTPVADPGALENTGEVLPEVRVLLPRCVQCKGMLLRATFEKNFIIQMTDIHCDIYIIRVYLIS